MSTFLSLPRKINIGSGKSFREDFLNIDIDAQWGPDIQADLSLPFPGEVSTFDTDRFGRVDIVPGEFDLILAHDVLEHIPDLVGVMTCCLDLLSLGGKMDIVVPYDLSYGAWQDPTHIRAFNERSWLYYTDWSWYLGWDNARFHVENLSFNLSEYGKDLHYSGMEQQQMIRHPRAVDSMAVVLRKEKLSPRDRIALKKYMPKKAKAKS